MSRPVHHRTADDVPPLSERLDLTGYLSSTSPHTYTTFDSAGGLDIGNESLEPYENLLPYDHVLLQVQQSRPTASSNTRVSTLLDTDTATAMPEEVFPVIGQQWTSPLSSYTQFPADNLACFPATQTTEITSPLHRAVASGKSQIVRLLLQHGSSANELDSQGNASLHLAVKLQHIAIVEILISYEADVHVRDSQKRTPLDLAIDGGNVVIVRMLLAHGAMTKN